MQPPSKRPLIVFDLDGTLVDSLRDIGEAVNDGLTLLGLPARPLTELRYTVGEGYAVLCQRLVGQTHPHYVRRLHELGSAFYRCRPLRHTRPYAGICELVRDLQADGCPLAVLSNKPHDVTRHIVEVLWPDGAFSQVQGYVREEWRKPSPHHLIELAEASGRRPAETWLIGDTPVDVETARRADARSIAVTWGFRPRDVLEQAGATLFADEPAQVRHILTTQVSP